MTAVRGVGVAGTLDHRIVREVAAAAEIGGYQAFWANDTPAGDGLAALAAAADVTTRLTLGVGVIPVDRTPPRTIAGRIRELDLPRDRVVVGIGAGGTRTGTVGLVRHAATALRDEGIRVFVGALGPRLCAVAGEAADGVLLNWLTPDQVKVSAQIVREAASEAGRSGTTIVAYVRAALEAGVPRLRAEATRYESFPQYHAHFERMGVPALATCVFGDAGAVASGLCPFDEVLDATIVRAITEDDSARAYLQLLAAASPRSNSPAGS